MFGGSETESSGGHPRGTKDTLQRTAGECHSDSLTVPADDTECWDAGRVTPISLAHQRVLCGQKHSPSEASAFAVHAASAYRLNSSDHVRVRWCRVRIASPNASIMMQSSNNVTAVQAAIQNRPGPAQPAAIIRAPQMANNQ